MLRTLLLVLLFSPSVFALQKADAVARLRRISEHLAVTYQSEAVRFESATTQLFSPRSEYTPSREVIWNSLDKKRGTQIKLELLSYLISRFEGRYVESNDVQIFTREALRDYMLGLGSPEVSKSSDTDTAIEILIDIGEKLRVEVETDFFERFEVILTKEDLTPIEVETPTVEASAPVTSPSQSTDPAPATPPPVTIPKAAPATPPTNSVEPAQSSEDSTPYTQDPGAETPATPATKPAATI